MSDETRQTHLLYDDEGDPTSDRPWIFRTYAGHTSARASNALYRSNLAAGQVGLSIAFDLPTQTGYSSDHPLARPEVGKVGVPINSLDDFHVLFEGIPLEQMNTSMTINATAMWMLALYVALARERGEDVSKLQGTTQNDIVKEYLARGTYIFPPDASLRLIAETYEYCLEEIPKWNPSNICSYHLQEAGATPAQELAFALANAIGILDEIRERGNITDERFEAVVGRISFFVNSGIRFVEEMSKMRAFTELWDEITRERYGVENPRFRRFRYGVQVNSLGLTEQQPENNAWRILLETLGVTLSRNARCRALQLPAWNEALGLPRPWDQQWALRLQQILAYESDLLEYPDLFDGSPVIESKVNDLKAQARAEIDRILEAGGIRAAVESGYMKSALVASMAERVSAINTGDKIVVGVNRWTDALDSPLASDEEGGIFRIDPDEARWTTDRLEETKRNRDDAKAQAGPSDPRGRRDGGREPDGDLDRLRPRPRHHRRVVGCAPPRLRRVPPADRHRGPTPRTDRRADGAPPRAVQRLRHAHRPATSHRHRQTRPRRPLQRRRGDRRRRPRRGLRGDLLRHPPHPGGDRSLRCRRVRACDRYLDPERIAPRAGGAADDRAGGSGRGRRDRGRLWRHHSSRGHAHPRGPRDQAGVHAV